MTSYLENGICTCWGLWDCGIQGAMGCYLAAYISAGNTVKVGDKIDIPSIGTVEVLANDALVAGQETAAENNGVVLLPERVVFTAENVADYNFYLANMDLLASELLRGLLCGEAMAMMACPLGSHKWTVFRKGRRFQW